MGVNDVLIFPALTARKQIRHTRWTASCVKGHTCDDKTRV